MVRGPRSWKTGHENQALPGLNMKSIKPFAVCLDNTGYEASLIVGKVYRLLPDKKAAKDDLVRLADETGEDYLFHKNHFVFVDFPKTVKSKILALEKG